MGRPYNKKTIEEAALLAETLASNQHLGDMQWVALFLGIRESSTAFTLAVQAFTVVNLTTDLGIEDVEAWAEAAALIADGWQIGDEVVLLDHVDGTAYAEGSFVEGEPVIERTLVSVPLSDGGITSIAESPMTDEMKSKASTALEAMTTAPVETETKLIGGANVMDENGLEPPTAEQVEPAQDDGAIPFNFYAQDDDAE